MSQTKTSGSSKEVGVGGEGMTEAQMFQKARKEAALKVPIKRGQQYNAAVKTALLKIKKHEARKLALTSDDVDDDAEDEMENDEGEIDDNQDDEDEDWLDDMEEGDSSHSAVQEVAMYEKAMNAKEAVVRRASSSSVGGKPKPLTRRDSGKSVASLSGSLGAVSKLPQKRTAKQASKKYGETDEAAVTKGKAAKGKTTQVTLDESEDSEMEYEELIPAPRKKRTVKSKSETIMHDDGEGGVSMDIADGSTQLSLTPFLCYIGDDVQVKVSKFRTKWYVCIREFKEGRAQNRGINLELCIIKKLKAAIDAAVLHTKM